MPLSPYGTAAQILAERHEVIVDALKEALTEEANGGADLDGIADRLEAELALRPVP